jgi:hypothetical protein
MFEERNLRDLLWRGARNKSGLEVIAYGALHDRLKKNEIGGAYSMYRGEEKYIKGFGGKTRWKETLRRNRRR